MKQLFGDAMRAFGRAFVSSFVVLLPGIWLAPNLDATLALSGAALVASFSAALKVLQTFIPQISWAEIIKSKPWAARADSFTRAFLSALVTGLTGWLAIPDLSTWRSAVFGILVGAGAAGLRTVEAWLTPGESPQPGKGLVLPAAPVAPAA